MNITSTSTFYIKVGNCVWDMVVFRGLSPEGFQCVSPPFTILVVIKIICDEKKNIKELDLTGE
jgi:hypothetical protein